MNIKKLTIIAALFLLLGSCSDKASIINTEYPSVTIEHIDYESDFDEDYGFSWPKFSSENEKLEQILNEKLSMEVILGQSFESIQAELESSFEEYGMPQGIVGASYNVNMNDGFILDIEFSHVSLGAHHYYWDQHSTINLQTGESLEVNDIIDEEQYSWLIGACNEQIQYLAEKIIFEGQAYEGIDLSEEAYAYAEFSDYNLDNFYISPGGITFMVDIELPEYMRAYDRGDLGCYCDFNDYGYLAKEGSILQDYINLNRDKIEELDTEESGIAIEGTRHEFRTVSTLSELEDALRTIEEGSTIMIDDDLEIDEAITINRSGLTIVGSQITKPKIIISDDQSLILNIENCENIEIKNLTMYHFTFDMSCSEGVILLDNCHHITIDNCDICGCGLYGISADESCRNISITNNRIYDCTDYGIDINAAATIIKGNTFYRNGDSEEDDYYIGSRFIGTSTVEDNEHYGWNSEYLVRITNREKEDLQLIEREFECDFGEGSVKAYFTPRDMQYIEVSWGEIVDEFKMTAYIGGGDLMMAEWEITYGDTDAPDAGEMYQETYKFRAISEVNKLDRIFMDVPGEDETEITDADLHRKYYWDIRGLVGKWEHLLDSDLEIEDVFTERFFDHDGQIVRD